jgi:predicted RNase H-like nuclease (RuvC/YqgF family)
VTFTLGWKSGLVALVLVILGTWAVTWAITRSNKQTVIDYERTQLILELEKELTKSDREAVEAHSEANIARDESAKSEAELATALKELDALNKEKPSGAVVTREYRLLKFTVPLLREQLILKKREVVSLRREIAYMTVSRNLLDERYGLQGKRLESAQKRQKKQKRTTIWTSVGVAVAGLAVGFGIGAASQ